MTADPRRDPVAYPIVGEVRPRYRDVDPLRHLNNVAQAEYYEEGVMTLHRAALAGVRREAGHGVVLRVNLHYLAEARYPEVLQLCSGVVRVGRSSYEFGQALFQGGRCISLCDTVVVYTVSGASAPVPETYRSGLEELMVKIAN
ncbi:conserved hypothetical protein [Phenylobacterium zucineum HLK1]|uniref:Uncharacterized protein n=1 Tax=Phenylobacterium zucineum (strain HLK1) TaxID=450851 RepID=B4RH14_PHEZH|nr:acyl-CoA thioesterase [Phenylobacterium zucineum]ACG78962.1 conserved hypothetical protein [Phenylobacterium zucineum HLK1]